MFPKFPTNTCFPKTNARVVQVLQVLFLLWGIPPTWCADISGCTLDQKVIQIEGTSAGLSTVIQRQRHTYGKCSTLFYTGLCPTLARMLAKSLNGTNASSVLKVSRAHGISIRRCCFCMLLLLSETMYWNELQPEASKDCSNISGQDSASFGLFTVPQIRACTCLCGYGSR